MIGTTGTCIPYGDIPAPITIGGPPYPAYIGGYIGDPPTGTPCDSELIALIVLAGDPGTCLVGDAS